MNQIVERIVPDLCVTVPITAPAQINAHGLGSRKNVSGE